MITDAMLETAIDVMPQNFDSHDVIIRLARDNQAPYIRALHAKVEAGVSVPFQALHASFGKRIKLICDARGYHFTPDEQNQSNDIFGRYSHCAAYKKLIWTGRPHRPRVLKFCSPNDPAVWVARGRGMVRCRTADPDPEPTSGGYARMSSFSRKENGNSGTRPARWLSFRGCHNRFDVVQSFKT